MSNKVAKLVTITVITRVIVDENATDEEITNAAKARLIYKAQNEYNDSGFEIEDDTECPFDPEDPDDVTPNSSPFFAVG